MSDEGRRGSMGCAVRPTRWAVRAACLAALGGCRPGDAPPPATVQIAPFGGATRGTTAPAEARSAAGCRYPFPALPRDTATVPFLDAVTGDPDLSAACAICTWVGNGPRACVYVGRDAKGRRVSYVSEQSGRKLEVHWTYTGDGEISESRENGKVWDRHHKRLDAAGRVVEEWSEGPNGARTLGIRRTYDGDGHLVDHVEESLGETGLETRFSWTNGRIASEEQRPVDHGVPGPVMWRWTHTHAEEGCLETITRDDVRATTFPSASVREMVRRDREGRIVERGLLSDDKTASSTIRYVYAGPLLMRKVEGIADALSTVTYEHDAKGRIVGMTSDATPPEHTSVSYECAGGP